MRSGSGLLALSLAMAILVSDAPFGAAAEAREPIVGSIASERVHAFGPLHDVRAAVALGRVAPAVRAAAGLASPIPEARSAPQPTSFGQAVHLLSTSVSRAGEGFRSAVPDIALAEELARRGVRMFERGPAMGARSRHAQRLLELGDALRSVVDTERLNSAAYELALAVDAALPVLQSAAAPARSDRAAECDILEVPAALCIGGQGSNTYTLDYALQIDLGGNDSYRNSAGGANVGTDGGNNLPAAITVDLSGNDVYSLDGPSPGGGRAVQGAGYLGIGMLVDAGGSDSYRASSTYPDPNGGGAQAYGQGAGVIGVGVLADLGGDDTYALADATRQDTAAYGHGWTLGGLGVLLDHGGNDRYLLSAHPSPTINARGEVDPGVALAQGGGFGAAGAGMMADAGGNDVARLEGMVGPVDPAEPRPVDEGGGEATGYGFGVLGGAGVLLTGSGDQRFEIVFEEATGNPPVGGGDMALAVATGFGASVLGGYGGVTDGGGDDTFLVKALSRAERRLTIEDGCACKKVQADAVAEPARALGFGFAAGAVAAFEDLGGNDVRLLEARTVAEAEAHDGRLDPPEAGPNSGAHAFADAWRAGAEGMGVGIVAFVPGHGFLFDAAGDDRYETVASSIATATATAASTASTTQEVARSGTASLTSHGASLQGEGELRDLGGSDTYVGRAESTTHAEDFPIPGEVSASALASVDQGAALFLDVGGADTFTLTLPDPACQGIRGQGTWVDCGQGAGVGHNT